MGLFKVKLNFDWWMTLLKFTARSLLPFIFYYIFVEPNFEGSNEAIYPSLFTFFLCCAFLLLNLMKRKILTLLLLWYYMWFSVFHHSLVFYGQASFSSCCLLDQFSYGIHDLSMDMHTTLIRSRNQNKFFLVCWISFLRGFMIYLWICTLLWLDRGTKTKGWYKW